MPTEDGYELWLRYRQVDNLERLAQYRAAIQTVVIPGESETMGIIRREIARSLPVLLTRPIPILTHPSTPNTLIIGTRGQLEPLSLSTPETESLGDEGFMIQTQGDNLLLTANTETALLTGTFHLLRLLQTHQDIQTLNIISHPRIRHRILAHWDNLDGSIERGYAGKSLWQWDDLPDQLDPRYHDYARACASIGINGACLNNVNAQAKSLTPEYLLKTAALANVFRPYGLRVYLAPLFSAPVQLGDLPTANPHDPAVAAWWQTKVDEIYRLIPDFGGFQIKANSEGQPGPQDYGANHHDGANLFARCLEPYGGLVLWRAFVYDTRIDPDRAKCGNLEFEPLDGQFNPNVMVQVKNGPIDFQPREPFHPLFGAMAKTPLALELQITQEYLGQSIHLVYLAEMWKEVLDADTFAQGAGSTLAKVVDGSLDGHELSCFVGVANTGSDRNWCGHPFSQANWYAFGRLAWEHQLSAETIAEEWIRATWSNDPQIIEPLKHLMLASWPACLSYMTPLGLHHLMQEGHHYGPDPGFDAAPRDDWNSTYYHRADAEGVGVNRSRSGSNAVSQYHLPLRDQFNNPHTCPEKYLLWFHHVPWHRPLSSGRTLWEELQHHYQEGVTVVEQMLATWQSLQPHIDPTRHQHIQERLTLQLENARQWRDECIRYFRQFLENSL